LFYASVDSHLEIMKYLIEECNASYAEFLEKLEKYEPENRRDQLEKIILEVADARVKFITSDNY